MKITAKLDNISDFDEFVATLHAAMYMMRPQACSKSWTFEITAEHTPCDLEKGC